MMLKNYCKLTQSCVICCSSIRKTSQRQLSSFTPILRQLILNAEKKLDKAPNYCRHTEILKKKSTALLIYAGPLTYDFIQKNMPEALPSLRSVQRIICSDYKAFPEGSFQFDDLASHIKNLCDISS